ncbi:MAG: ABC transporter ATP-binding protein, partial [Bdellovibrionales bacterium]|nr:ABC transporter ATP-binding protein [Bdellovibrionales bacterium]
HMITGHTPGYVGIFSLEDQEKMKQLVANKMNLDFHVDTSGMYLRVKTLTELTDFHSLHGLKPLQIRPSNLEDVFLKLTGQELAADA